MPGAPAYMFTVLESEVVFAAVEERLGMEHIKELRILYGGPTILPYRGWEEKLAERFSSEHPPEAEAAYYAQKAFDLLNKQSTIGGLTSEGNDA